MERKMRYSKGSWVAAAVVILYIGKFAANTLMGPSDSVLIHQALDEAIQASREGRPGGVLEYMSDSFKLNGTSYGGGDIADVVRNQKPDITVDNTEPTISGSYAKLTAPVHVKIGMLGFSQEIPLKNVTMAFHEESGHDFLLLPVKRWRLEQVTVPDHDIPNEFKGGMGN